MKLYSYTYDKDTGGLLLNSSPNGFSKEPRPVYAPELDLLGFNKYWTYDKQSDSPYMWAEANNYYYRGVLVAKLRGGNPYDAPGIIIPIGEDSNPIMPEAEGISLRPIDIEAMVRMNHEMLEVIEQTTVKKILAVYSKYKDKLDCFSVAFSGGKDSCVLLDLVKKALPKNSYVVVFGDTGMEFPDTYETVEMAKQQCLEEEIPFFIAKSHFGTKDSWELFGPPSRTLRWCCSVHKSAPQTLKLREVTGKDDYSGLAFVGVRAQESATRSEYEYESYGKKQMGQYSHNSMLEWTSAEVWIYIYSNDLKLNEAYKKGSARVGCICCPMGSGKSGFVEYENYKNAVSEYFEIIRNTNGRSNLNFDDFIKSCGWSARKNGRDLANNPIRCTERFENGYLTINIENPSSDWKEWIKTIDLPDGSFTVTETESGFEAKLKEEITKKKPLLSRLFRQVFHKAAFCIGCKVCEANCTNGAIRFIGSRIKVENCTHCLKCHEIDSGCLLYHSLRHPQGGGVQMLTLNTMSNHAPKKGWLDDFFTRKESFFISNFLNKKNQLGPFCRFLRDSELIDKANNILPLVDIANALGWDSNTSQGIILLNLVAGNPQMEWYVANFDIGIKYPKKDVIDMLTASGVKPSRLGNYYAHESICYAFKRLSDTPLGTNLHFGYVTEEGAFVRTKCSISNPVVVLYGLYKFAEKCNDYKEFTLSTLLNDNISRDGISPTRIFGLDRTDIKPMLIGLTAKYPEFIDAAFTHDLEKIKLSESKSSQDVLGLFKQGDENEWH